MTTVEKGTGVTSKLYHVKSGFQKLCANVKKTKPRNVVPILNWGLNYDIKNALVGDVIAGVTVAVMQVLSSMADAQLANINVVRGLYCSIFPVILYAIFGPSRHISIGTNSLICLLVGSILSDRKQTFIDYYGKADDDPNGDRVYLDNLTPILATIVLMVAAWQTVLAVIQFGKLSWMFSDIAMSGYTAAAGVTLLTSQLKTMFGLEYEKINGLLSLPYTWQEFFLNVQDTNFVTLGICLASIVLLVINEEFVKPFIMKKVGVPIPMQVLLVIIGIPLSIYLNLADEHGVQEVGQIPQGLPHVSLPDLHLAQYLIFDSLIIAIVGFGFTLSMAKLIAKKFGYSLNGNQELFAEGMSNIFGGLFQCLPASASMSRSMAQATAGGTTQLTGLVSSAILIGVLASFGYVLEHLPKCILSAVIVVALKGVLIQIGDFPEYFRKSKLDGLLWFGTFLGVILTTVDKGMIICIALTIFVMTYRNYQIDIIEMEDDDDGSESKDSDDTASVTSMDLNQNLALRIIGVVSFANYERVLKKCNKKLNRIKRSEKEDTEKPVLIIDLTSVPYLDQTACKAFIEWVGSIDEKAHISLVAPEGEVREMLKAHEYDEIQTFTDYANAKEQFQKGSLQTVVEEDGEGEVATLPGGKQVNIQVQVFEDEADEDFERNSEAMDKDRLEYLKKRRQSRQLHSKALAATCEYMKDNLPASGGSKPGTPLEARRGSMAIQARRGSVMVVPPKHIQRERTDSIF